MESNILLNGGIALVTGSAGGIGKETALAFAEAGVRAVVFADINETGAKEAAEESKKLARHVDFQAVSFKVDIADKDSVQSLVDATVQKFGRIDFAINSAGMGNVSAALTPNLNLDSFSMTVDTNVKGAVLFTHAITVAMQKQEPLTYTSRHGTRSLGRGSIVLLGSVNSYVTAPGMLPYVTSKHAVVGITKSAVSENKKSQAIDCFKSHIRVNTVCPSWVDTPMMQASLKRVPQLDKMIEAISPLRRPATVEEVADYIVFLCSPSASYINGTGLVIDAGATLTAHI